MEQIVVGIDGSETSQRALAWALEEARVRHAALTVVHAWHVIAYSSYAYFGPALDAASEESAAKELVERALAASDTTGVPIIRPVVVDGGAGGAILDAANDASLIVVGSRGHRAVTSFLLGSVSRYVLHHAGCPVVVVPPADRR